MRKIRLLVALVLFPALLAAQERFTVKGRIVNERGEGIEYVQLGVPRLQVGSISGPDGRFEIKVPCDTLVFFHVSYQPGYYPVTGPADDVVVVLRDQELTPAVAIGGKPREKYLMRPGTLILKGSGAISTSLSGENPTFREVGSVAKASKPFLVQDIMFTVRDNHIPGCVASINIYRIEGKKESFVNVLQRPIYFKVPESDEPMYFDVQPTWPLLLEPGKYFVSFQIVGYDKTVSPTEDMTMSFDIYLKNSYLRETVMGEMENFPVNIGVAVKGLEYQ